VSYSLATRESAMGPAWHIITPFSPPVAVFAASLPTSAAVWPAANLAIYVPIRIPWTAIVRKAVIFNGSAVSGNLDIGLYTGTGTRLWSSGSTAQSGTLQEQVVDVSPDITIAPGLYFSALSLDNTTGTILRNNSNVQLQMVSGIYTESSGFALPATATFAIDYTNAFQPLTGWALEATVT
jgi:hypothetical protein